MYYRVPDPVVLHVNVWLFFWGFFNCLAVVTAQGGSKGDLTHSLMHQLLRMMQAIGVDEGYTETAQTLIVKVGLFVSCCLISFNSYLCTLSLA